MKKYLFFPIMVFFCNVLFAQEKTYTQAMDSLLSHIDKTTMTTSILYNRAAPYDDLDTDTSPL